MGAAAAQTLPESTLVRGRPYGLYALANRQVVYCHLNPIQRSGPGPDSIAPGTPLGYIPPYPTPLSERHDETIIKARALYDRQQYREAAALLERAYADEPDNRFVRNEYARTLFWIDGSRDRSFEIYHRLIDELDHGCTRTKGDVPVDLWFLEAYWKIASLYLDRAEYEKAAYEITRFLSIGTGQPPHVREQAYVYLAEAYGHLRNFPVARTYAEQALRLNPRSQGALEQLSDMGSGATSWDSIHVFACRAPADTLPCTGAYSFRRTATGIACTEPKEDGDYTGILCLRVGWVYVGEPRADLERVLGAPWQTVPTQGGGSAHVYLVFQDTVRRTGAYYVVEYERAGGDDVARVVQLTGSPLPLPFDFSGIRLGDDARRIVVQLGEPAKRGPFSDDAVGLRGEYADYTVMPISFEIVGGRIYSIRVWRPDAAPPRKWRPDFTKLY